MVDGFSIVPHHFLGCLKISVKNLIRFIKSKSSIPFLTGFITDPLSFKHELLSNLSLCNHNCLHMCVHVSSLLSNFVVSCLN